MRGGEVGNMRKNIMLCLESMHMAIWCPACHQQGRKVLVKRGAAPVGYVDLKLEASSFVWCATRPLYDFAEAHGEHESWCTCTSLVGSAFGKGDNSARATHWPPVS